jgi:DUF2971 family protein
MTDRTDSLEIEMEAELFKDAERERPDKPLFHYTDAAGLKGVLETKQLWATHFEHLNDQSELRIGEDLVTKEAEGLARELPERSARRFIVEQFAAMHPEQRLSRVGSIYLASLSEHGDQLSQWRAYGADGSGYAIGFRSLPIPEPDTTEAAAGLILLKCEYDASVFRRRIYQILLEISAGFEKFVHSERGLTNTQAVGSIALSICLRRVAVEVPRLKDKAFEEEGEWRLVGFTSTDRDKEVVKFRTSARALVPYMPIPVSDGECMDLDAVVVGPRQDADRARRTAAILLRHHGYSEEILRSSRAPYRGRAV